MPYIKQERRAEIWSDRPKTTGELNYYLTMTVLDYLELLRIERGTQNTYDDYNSVIGVLECCKQELYRRVVTSYENEKINENGDVY